MTGWYDDNDNQHVTGGAELHYGYSSKCVYVGPTRGVEKGKNDWRFFDCDSKC